MKQNNNNKKSQKQYPKVANPLEALKDIGTHTVNQMQEEIAQFPQNFFDELIGGPRPLENHSGEIVLGDTVEMTEVLSGRNEEETVMRQQIAFERRIFAEEKQASEKKTNELKIQLKMIQEELVQIAQSTQTLAEETEIAANQQAIDPGVYHLIFFEKLLEFVRSFRKKINEGNVWLHSVNQRTAKKNSWGANYKKHGAKYLLSSEHYLARSAG